LSFIAQHKTDFIQALVCINIDKRESLCE